MEDKPTPNPPNNLIKAKKYGSLAKAEPSAENRYSIANEIRIFFRPNCSHNTPPLRAPKTVPHKADDMTIAP